MLTDNYNKQTTTFGLLELLYAAKNCILEETEAGYTGPLHSPGALEALQAKVGGGKIGHQNQETQTKMILEQNHPVIVGGLVCSQ